MWVLIADYVITLFWMILAFIYHWGWGMEEPDQLSGIFCLLMALLFKPRKVDE
jgi:hypothetical protein